MRLLLNVVWFVLAGLWLAIGYTFAALICFLLVVTIPFGIAALRIARFALWPFGKTVVGWWLALAHLITGVALCISIIGIPLGLANFKLIPVSLLPLGREIVDVDEANRIDADAAVTVSHR